MRHGLLLDLRTCHDKTRTLQLHVVQVYTISFEIYLVTSLVGLKPHIIYRKYLFKHFQNQVFQNKIVLLKEMAVVVDVVGHFHWIFLLIGASIMRNSNGFQMAFFRYADQQFPHFYLTQDEIAEAMKTDKTWKEEAEAMGLQKLLEQHQVEIPGQTETKGLDMEKFNELVRIGK